MKKYQFTKVYPYERSVFDRRFVDRTFPFRLAVMLNWAHVIQTTDRIFVGDLRKNCFKVYIYYGIQDNFLEPWLSFKRLSVIMVPSCIYGCINETDGRTVVDYKIDKVGTRKLMAVLGSLVWTLLLVDRILSMAADGMNITGVLSSVIFALQAICFLLSLKHSKTEQEALTKFMEDLED